MAKSVAKIWTAPETIGDAERLSCAYSMIAARGALHSSFPSAFLHDPALEIMLGLFVARAEQQYLSLDDLVNTSYVPCSVLVRWLKVLESAGTVLVHGSGTENQTYNLSLQGVREMDSAMSAVIRSQIALHGHCSS